MPHSAPPASGNPSQTEKAQFAALGAKRWVVQTISLSRLLAALLFASLAFQDIPLELLAGIYGFAMCSDLLDGLLARRLKMQSYAGKIIDLISDKSLSVVSLLYAAKHGVHLFPLALIAVREIIVIGLRAITIAGTQLLPTSRIFGGIMAMLLWGNTLFLVFVSEEAQSMGTVNRVYWLCALLFTANLAARIYVSRRRIMAAITKVE